MMRNLNRLLTGRKPGTERGATVVEFAFVAVPFLTMLFALVEITMLFFVQTTLEAAVAEEARRIRTGQAQTTTQTAFRQGVCDRLYGLADCDNRLFVMVKAYDDTAIPTGPGVDPWADGILNRDNPADEPFESSVAGQMVIVRAYYAWPVMTPGLNLIGGTSGLSGNKPGGGGSVPIDFGDSNRMLVATAAFRNEPFQ